MARGSRVLKTDDSVRAAAVLKEHFQEYAQAKERLSAINAGLKGILDRFEAKGGNRKLIPVVYQRAMKTRDRVTAMDSEIRTAEIVLGFRQPDLIDQDEPFTLVTPTNQLGLAEERLHEAD